MANLSALERTIAKYDAQAPNIQQDIKNKINAQFDNGKPWLEDTARWERDILPAFYKQFAEQGTGAADLSPAQQMLQGSNNAARSGRLADVGSGIYARQQQRESDMLKDQLTAWQMSRQTAVDAWNREMQRQAAAAANAARRAPVIPEIEYAGGEKQAATSLEELNKKRKAQGQPAVDQNYFNTVYNRTIATPPQAGVFTGSNFNNTIQRQRQTPFWSAIRSFLNPSGSSWGIIK